MRLQMKSLVLAMAMGGTGLLSGCTRTVDGAPGAQGIQGETGATGAIGAQGIQGETGPQGPQGATGPHGDAGLKSLMRTTLEMAGTNCATGGVLIEVGIASDGDGTLSNAEVSSGSSKFVCNGAVGPQGIVGPVGPMGPMGPRGDAGINALTKSSAEAPGANCATGGTKLELGLDLDGDGTLGAGEVTSMLTRYVCNGAVGATGAQGPVGPIGLQGVAGLNSLTKTTAEAAGANCATGGSKLEFGIDADGNGSLAAGEINATLTRYVCNGAVGATGATGAVGPIGLQGVPGLNSLTRTTAEAAGANCATGGSKLEFGIDADGNG